MRERAIILAAFDELLADDACAAIATVVAVEGSSYRRPGARMLVAADGRCWGGVSGGCLERDVARVGRHVIESGEATLKRYETAVDDDWQDRPADPAASLGCGGAIEILVERVSSNELAAIEPLRRARNGETFSTATVFRSGGAVTLQAGDRINCADERDEACVATIREHLRAIAEGASQRARPSDSRRHVFASGWLDVLYETFSPPQSLVIFGDGPDVVPVVELGRLLGWRVTVVGGRPVAAMWERIANADAHVYWPGDETGIDEVSFADAAVVVMQHNLARDAAALLRLARESLAYLGLLGPRHRTRRILDALPADARSSLDLHSPIGLDIGADGPEQIALAVVAEIQATLAGRSAEPLSAVAARVAERDS